MPEKVAITEEIEWVDVPKPGDCVVLRMDPVASVEHLESESLSSVTKRIRAMHYLAFIGAVCYMVN